MTDSGLGASAFEQHPLRARILGELHARPTRPLEAPARILHFAFLTDSTRAEADRLALTELCVERGLTGPDPQTRQFRVELQGATLMWERHGEFITHGWEFAGVEADEPFSPTPAALMQKIRMLPQPGPLLVAADLHMLHGDRDPASLGAVFGPLQAAIAEANAGRALIATDFAPDTFGFVRIFIANRSMPPMAAGRLAQRALEVETYRTLALMGLPEAQNLAPSIRRIEQELPRLLDAMTQATGVEQNRHLLDALTSLASELEVGAAASLYRFGATRAYDDLVNSRLEAINETPLPDYPSWSGFLTRRLQPAMRTCRNTEARQADLSRKLARAAQLLRTRVDTEVEAQNGDLLRQMGERVKLQLRLQQTVEGLSIAAITYYIASVFHHLLEGAREAGAHVEPDRDTAILIPFIVAFVGWTVWRIRRKHHAE
ncbi:DUF3422 domain-containing protein [Rhodoblastus acidophilus]|uniref:DUF3422 domain-containing protein n=1 Tax=Candidatus Rhodoblastus alkanivorans TaxID=2954117 RepID=A0ABS9Z4V4_9HYPH|nr:DUF3422 domain-containing protein [Candidatus Rhodoblastus alkanivorans]MCI4679888.1 DUF3422 domain-containing protein [Candidatus Rhodoblastus alkanivorans]MCI4682709.1 DUF3422 domain-containing protein [Candidatus Rhodoblastus alkanivorans]MDI4640016.1 DUF3422 domain-containing protein [Rhodoblastus acidophilus]